MLEYKFKHVTSLLKNAYASPYYLGIKDKL